MRCLTPVAHLKYRRSATDDGRGGTAVLAAASPPNPDARPARGQRRLTGNRRTYPQKPEQPRPTPSPRRTRPEPSGAPQQVRQTPAAEVLHAHDGVIAVDE